MKLDITKGIQKKGVDVPFELEDAWGEDHWNGDTIAYVGPVSLSGTYMLADETVLVRGEARAVIQSRCARCLTPTNTPVTAEVDEETVYQMPKTFWENWDMLTLTHAALRKASLEEACTDLAGVPIHEGAARYYREVGVLE